MKDIHKAIMVAILLATLSAVAYVGSYTSRCPKTKAAIMAVMRESPPQGLLAGAILLDRFPIIVTLSQSGDFTIFLAVDDGMKACPISGSSWNFFAPFALAPSDPPVRSLPL